MHRLAWAACLLSASWAHAQSDADLPMPDGAVIFVPERGALVADADATLRRTDLTWLRRAQVLLQRAELAEARRFEMLDRRVRGEGVDRTEAEALAAQAASDFQQASNVLRDGLRVRPRPYTREVGVGVWTWVLLLDRLETRATARRRTAPTASATGSATDAEGADLDAEAVAALLATECPDCPLAADAHVYLGDHAYARADLDAARAHFDAAVSVARSTDSIRAYAFYKLGWLAITTGDTDAGLDAFRNARRLGNPYLGRTVARDAVGLLLAQSLPPEAVVEQLRGLVEDEAEARALIEREAERNRRPRVMERQP